VKCALLFHLSLSLFFPSSLFGCAENKAAPSAAPPEEAPPSAPDPAAGAEQPLPSRHPLPATSHKMVRPVPAQADTLFAFLRAQDYRAFSESAEVQNSSAHGAGRTFQNPILANSMHAGEERHPVGSAAVKELFNAKGDLFGWTVMVKLSSDSGDGNDWFWYEVHNLSDGSHPVASRRGVPVCVRCHTAAPDFVHPLPDESSQ
jgi:hypothetical protein